MKLQKFTIHYVLILAMLVLAFGFSTRTDPLEKIPIADENSLNDNAIDENDRLFSDGTTNTARKGSVISTQASATLPDISNSNNKVGVDSKNFQQNEFVREYIFGNKTIKEPNGNTYPLRNYRVSAESTDPFAGQWWEEDIKLTDAWDISTGSGDTLVAIIDSGFALAHEEFSDTWYTNADEYGPTTVENESRLNCNDRGLPLNASCNLIDDNFDGIVDNETGSVTTENPSQLNCTDQGIPLDKSCNLVDDDDNDLVDDWRGWDFVQFDRSVQTGEINANGSGVRHGTQVSGLVAAPGDNNVGIAGVNWRTKILPIQAISDNNAGNSLTVARGIRYAVSQGADVINLSLGGAFPDSFLRQTIREATAAGVIVVAAAGNDGCDCMSYPANYQEVLAVGALATDGQRASFSSYGTTLDIMAPGMAITSSSWSQANETGLYSSGIAGTSFAAPIVSGLLASLRTLQPDASQTELLALLTETVDKSAISAPNVRSNTFGFGVTSAELAFLRATTPQSPAQATTFSGIKNGDGIAASPALEADSAINVYDCPVASTAVFKLAKGSDIFYSSSLIEQVVAVSSGYSSQLFAYTCVLHDHDTPDHMRTLMTMLEFDNVFRKSSL